jgi:hypothetical protein
MEQCELLVHMCLYIALTETIGRLCVEFEMGDSPDAFVYLQCLAVFTHNKSFFTQYRWSKGNWRESYEAADKVVLVHAVKVYWGR